MKKLLNKIKNKYAAAAVLIATVGQTIDMSPIINMVMNVVPLFLIILVVKILFQTFREFD